MFMLGDFIRVLRAAEVRISTAESIEAAAIVETIGLGDRQLMRTALSQALAKTDAEKDAFHACFDEYFGAMLDAVKSSNNGSSKEDASADGASGEPQDPHEQDDGDISGEATPSHDLAEMLLNNDEAGLAARLVQAASDADMSDVRLFTQQGLFTRRIMEMMGLEEVEAAIQNARNSGDGEYESNLRHARQRLFEMARDFVEKQIAMRTANSGKLVREEALSRIKLSNLDRSDMHIMRGLIAKLAKRLAALHSRRQKRSKRGLIDVRKTLRKNQSHDGLLIDLQWRSVEVSRPRLITMCDVSGSVAAVSRFLLMFLYSLDEVMPRTRSFAFSHACGEITDLFDRMEPEAAMTDTLMRFGGGSTDYGNAFTDLARLVMDDLDHKTTLMILGDGRSNYGDPGHEILREMSNRCRRVIWLNPESKALWDTGDSEMKRLGAYCHSVQVCNSVRHLERVLDDMLRLSI